MIKLFVIDDHSVFVEGIVSALNARNIDIKVVGSALNCKSGIEDLKNQDVDVVILDLIMPEMGGIECSKYVREVTPDSKIVVLTSELDPAILIKIWLENIDALISKNSGLDELIEVVEGVMNNQRIIGKNLPHFFSYCEVDDGNIPQLSKTEMEVLSLLASGLTRKEIADTLYRAVSTIDFHCKNLFRKFNTKKMHLIIEEAKKMRIIN